MPPKLTGHLLQLLGHALVFLGLGFAFLAMVIATNYYSVPFWVFVLAAIAIGAPVMVAGGRINSVGRGLVLGISAEEATKEYRRGTVLLGVYLGVLRLPRHTGDSCAANPLQRRVHNSEPPARSDLDHRLDVHFLCGPVLDHATSHACRRAQVRTVTANVHCPTQQHPHESNFPLSPPATAR